MAEDQPPATPSTRLVVAIVYLSFFLDNVLLTVVVPIIPDYLLMVETLTAENKHMSYANRTLEDAVGEENGRVGILLSSKAVVQLVVNPFVGYVARYAGYNLPLFIGSVNLLASALLFAFGESYASLFVARSLQGISSACIGVSGMCLVAEHFPSESSRSRVMGVVLGSVALGVLFGYPFGGFLYDFVGKMAPFLIIATLILVNIVLQLGFMNFESVQEQTVVATSWSRLLSDGLVVLTAGAIWLSSTAMAILEPCLPLWLMTNIKPEKWELGTVFLPDSLGYLIGTNSFGVIAYQLGRWKVAIVAMLLVGLSALLVPNAEGMGGLVVPHFCLGLGIGAVDAALVPLLASLVDTRHSANYAAVYALQQTAVSLAYSLGPMVGGELVRAVGFPWLLRSIGLLNILYSPLLAMLSHAKAQDVPLISNSAHVVNYKSNELVTPKYKRFFDSDESD